MPNYKDTAGNLHFLDDAKFTYLLPKDCVEIADEEAAAIQLSAQQRLAAEALPVNTLADQILDDPAALAKLKMALGLV